MGSLRTGIRIGLVSMVMALSSMGCKQAMVVPPPVFEVLVKVESDPNRPVAQAAVSHRDRDLASTGPDGRAKVTLEGHDGEVAELRVRCPVTHEQPKPIPVSLRRFEGGKVAEYSVRCPPLVRRVVVGVRAENGPNLPVRFLGNVVAVTDANGAAHFALDVKPGETFEVALETDSRPKLLPHNPTRAFVMPPRDEVLLFSQTFSTEKKRPTYRAAPRSSGPKRM